MSLNPFRRITRTYRHIRRYREITAVLLKHGFGDLASTLGLRRHKPFSRYFNPLPPDQAPISHYERLRLAVEELGPSYIKLGQLLSTRRDVFPYELIVELEKLQDEVPPFPGDEAQEIVEEELGKPLTELFRDFQMESLASASIAQVHRAETFDGRRLAVKVRRPRIERAIETDLEIMKQLAQLAEKVIEGAEVFGLPRIVDEFARTIRKELDFSLEASHMERFARIFDGDKRIRVPEVYRNLTTEKVLCMEYVAGTKISRVDEFAAHGLDPKTVADRGAGLILEQVFTHGFFHADPHPGNIIVLPENVLCLFDYGTMGSLSERFREHLGKLIIGFVDRDEHCVTSAVLELSGYTGFTETAALESDITNFLEDHMYRAIGDIRVGRVLSSLSRLLIRHHIHMPPVFFLMVKCLTEIEGIGRQLIGEFDLLQYMEPFAKKLARERVSVRKMLRDAYLMADELRMMARDLPGELRQIMALFKHGDLGIKFEHVGLDQLTHTHDQMSNRLVFGLVLAALIVGSSIMVLSGIPPKWHEIPVIGVVGFVLSGLLGFSLLISILRHGKM